MHTVTLRQFWHSFALLLSPPICRVFGTICAFFVTGAQKSNASFLLPFPVMEEGSQVPVRRPLPLPANENTLRERRVSCWSATCIVSVRTVCGHSSHDWQLMTQSSHFRRNYCALRFRTTTPEMMSPKPESRSRLADSSNKMIPSSAVTAVPLPAHTA